MPGRDRGLPGPCAHPAGEIAVDLRFTDGCQGSVILPDGVPGAFHWQGETIALAAGRTTVAVPDAGPQT